MRCSAYLFGCSSNLSTTALTPQRPEGRADVCQGIRVRISYRLLSASPEAHVWRALGACGGHWPRQGGGGRHEHLATEDTVTMAARLEGLAAPNTVGMSQVTVRRAPGAFALEDWGLQVFKNDGRSNRGVPPHPSDCCRRCALPGRTVRRTWVAGAALGAEFRGTWPGGGGHAARARGKAWPPVDGTGRLRRVCSRATVLWNASPFNAQEALVLYRPKPL